MSILDSIQTAREEQTKTKTLMATAAAASATGNYQVAREAAVEAALSAGRARSAAGYASSAGIDQRREEVAGLLGWPWGKIALGGLALAGLGYLLKKKRGRGRKRGR